MTAWSAARVEKLLEKKIKTRTSTAWKDSQNQKRDKEREAEMLILWSCSPAVALQQWCWALLHLQSSSEGTLGWKVMASFLLPLGKDWEKNAPLVKWQADVKRFQRDGTKSSTAYLQCVCFFFKGLLDIHFAWRVIWKKETKLTIWEICLIPSFIYSYSCDWVYRVWKSISALTAV